MTQKLVFLSADDMLFNYMAAEPLGHPKGVQLTNGNYLDVLDQAANGGHVETGMKARPVLLLCPSSMLPVSMLESLTSL